MIHFPMYIHVLAFQIPLHLLPFMGIAKIDVLAYIKMFSAINDNIDFAMSQLL